MPTNRRSFMPSGVRTRARSSVPYSPSSSSTATPSLKSEDLMSARASSQIASVRGAANTASCNALSPYTRMICWTAPSGPAWTRISTPSTTGTFRLPRSSSSTPSGASPRSQGPVAAGSSGSSATGVSTSSGLDRESAECRPERRSSALWCRPPLPRPREKITVSPFRRSDQPGVAAGGTVPTRAPYRVWQVVDAPEVGPFDALHDKLRNPVTTRNLPDPVPVVVDQIDHDFAAVAGVDRTGRVEHRDNEPGGQARAGMHQADVPV